VWSRGRAEIVTGLVAAVLGVAYLLLPRMGTDLAAQVARAGFFADHGYTPIDLRWYAGVDQLGYSLLSQPVMALLGVRVTGVIALVVASVTLAALLRRTGAPRPLLGVLFGTVCIGGNLVSGRVTYGLGVLFALAALLALTYPRLRWTAMIGALLASATSPVAGLFLGLAGVALLASRRVADGLLVAVPAAVPLAVSGVLFGDGGWMNISHTDALRAIVTSLVVAVLVPLRPVRIAGVLSAVGVLAAALVHTPVGLNATRLVVMFGLPVLAAYAAVPSGRTVLAAYAAIARVTTARRRLAAPAEPSPSASPPASPSLSAPASASASPSASRSASASASASASNGPAGSVSSGRAGDGRHSRGTADSPRPWWRPVALVVLLLAVCWWQPPVVVSDMRDIGNPTADPAYFAPLKARLAQQRLTGRVEIPPTRDYWEAAYLGDVPLARGWLRQADIDRNPLFFTTVPGAAGTGVSLTPDSYRAWLSDQAVQFVGVPSTELSWAGRDEAALIAAGMPYLTPVWSDAHWRLYAVLNPEPIVAPPATLVTQTAAALTFDAPTAGSVPIRVRHYRWLKATGGATVVASGDWTVVRVTTPGRYTLTS
jgi:hypothetical protein